MSKITRDYHELQGVPNLHATIDRILTPNGSNTEQTVRCLYVAIAVNITQSSFQLTSFNDLWKQGSNDRALKSLSWSIEFLQLSVLICERIEYCTQIRKISSLPDIAEVIEYFSTATHKLEETFSDWAGLPLDSSMQPLDNKLRLFFFFRMLMLSHLESCFGNISRHKDKRFDEYILNVIDTTNADGVEPFNAFRGMHQIPEILSYAINNFLLHDSSGKYVESSHLILATKLVEINSQCNLSLLRQLVASDYHRIRSHLGFTSGSHSHEISRILLKEKLDDICGIVTEAFENGCDENAEAGLMFLNALRAWRNSHIGLPYLNLGGTGTRSLIGASDAISTVLSMHSVAESKLSESLGTSIFRTQTFPIEKSTQLERMLSERLGHKTKEMFLDVQERTGYFSRNNNANK